MGWEGLSDNHVARGAQRQQADNKAGGDEPPNPTLHIAQAQPSWRCYTTAA